MRAASDGDAVPRRRIARNGAAAPCVSADGRRRRRPLEGVAVADNPSVPVANIEIRFLRPVGIQFGLEHVAAREGQCVRTLDEGRFVCRRIKISRKGIEVDCSRIRQRQLRCGILERDLLEVLNPADACRRTDVQRIALRRAVAAGDCARDRAARKRDGIVTRRAVCRRRIAAVDVANRAARDGDGIVVAVILVVLRRARAARMSAVDVRIVAAYGDRVVMRGVARLRDAAECVSTYDARRLCAGELVALVGDCGDSAEAVLADIDVRLSRVRRLGLRRARVSREVDAALVLQQGQRFHRRSRCRELRPVHLGRISARDGQQRAVLYRARRIERDLLESCNLPCAVRALDIQRVARAAVFAAPDCTRDDRAVDVDDIIVRRRSVTAVDIARHRCAVRQGDYVIVCRETVAAKDIPSHLPTAQMDFVIVCRPTLSMSTVDSPCHRHAVQMDFVLVCRPTAAAVDRSHRHAVQMNFVVRRLAARDIGVAAVDGVADRSRAVHCDVVMRAVALVRCCSL